MSSLKQISTVSYMNISSIPQRLGLSFATIFSVALVVGVLLCFLAMAQGFQKTMKSTGNEEVAVVLRSGAVAEINSSITLEQARIMEEGPGIVKINGQPIVSKELYVIVDGLKKSSQTQANLSLRGIGPFGPALRENVQIVEGRMFNPGTNEIIVGKSLLSQFSGFELGKTVRLGTADWKIVGIFAAPGTVFESELWADAQLIQNFFNRSGIYQTLRIKMEDANLIEPLKEFSIKDPRLQLDVKSENDFYAEQSNATSDLIFYLGWPLAIAMAIGALAGAANTMYNSIASRTREIVTLRTIGFSGLSAFIGTLIESTLLAIIGGLIGALFAYFLFDGLTTSTLGENFTQVVFRFELTPILVLKGIFLAISIGLLGGLLPARNAAKMSLVNTTYIV